MEYPVKPVRAFIAVDLPDNIKESISSLFDRLDKTKIPVKTVKPENLHLTLKFLGGCRQNELEKIKAALRACAEAAEPFPLRFRGVGAFQSAQRPSVLWAGAYDETCGLASLAEELEERLRQTGRDKKARPFHPHVTAARVRKSVNSSGSKIIRQWLEENRNIDFGVMRVRRLSLLESRLSSEGPSYSLLGGFDIRNSRA